MRFVDTTAAPKYGVTPVYGECETNGCTAKARTTCSACGGEHCLGHVEHVAHAQHERPNTSR